MAQLPSNLRSWTFGKGKLGRRDYSYISAGPPCCGWPVADRNEAVARNRRFAQAFTSSLLRRIDRSALPLGLLCEQEEAKGEVLLPGESPGVFLQLCARNLLPFQATWTAPLWGPPLLPVPQPMPEPPSGGLNCQTLTPPSCSLRACPSHKRPPLLSSQISGPTCCLHWQQSGGAW